MPLFLVSKGGFVLKNNKEYIDENGYVYENSGIDLDFSPMSD